MRQRDLAGRSTSRPEPRRYLEPPRKPIRLDPRVVSLWRARLDTALAVSSWSLGNSTRILSSLFRSSCNTSGLPLASYAAGLPDACQGWHRHCIGVD
jgi:hypothetical protein